MSRSAGRFPRAESAAARGKPAASRRVSLYVADGCHLCGRALEIVRDAQAELGFQLELVDIGGHPELEAAYRERLPVLEIDGRPAFTYFVSPAALRERLA